MFDGSVAQSREPSSQMPTFPSPPARVEAVARSARGPRSRSRCVRAWPHYTPPLAPPTQQVSKEVVIFTTLITPIDLAITPINFQSKSAFFACWKRVAPSRLQSVFGRSFFLYFCGLLCDYFWMLCCPSRAHVCLLYQFGWCGPLGLLQGSICVTFVAVGCP